MNYKSILLCVIATCLAFWGTAQARPSLTTIDQKLDQLLEGQANIRADIAALREELLPGSATCEDIEYSGTMWGATVRGVDLRAYTSSTLHFIGCLDGQGCIPSQFFCSDNQVTGTLTFGAPAGALRALVDPGDAAGASMTGGTLACASETNPDGVHNAPDKPADARALCRALGYTDGTVQADPLNSCPEPSALDLDGLSWTSDFVRSFGYGQSYTCIGGR